MGCSAAHAAAAHERPVVHHNGMRRPALAKAGVNGANLRLGSPVGPTPQPLLALTPCLHFPEGFLQMGRRPTSPAPVSYNPTQSNSLSDRSAHKQPPVPDAGVRGWASASLVRHGL
jgi:hypothetical protein